MGGGPGVLSSPGLFALPRPAVPTIGYLGPAHLPTLNPFRPLKDRALAMVHAFAAGNSPGVFTRIAPGDVARGLLARLAHPDGIDQGRSSLCGPAAFVRGLLESDPVAYVSLVIDLYTRGAATIGRLSITAGQDLREYAPAGVVDPADWIPLASIRDSENWFFDYQAGEDDFAGITLPSHLEAWFTKVGYTSIVSDTSVIQEADEPNLRRADELFRNGYWVCLFVNAAVMRTKTQHDVSLTPDHWIVLRSPVAFRSPDVELWVFSWGQGRHKIPGKGALTLDDFLDHYYGFVAAKY